MAVGCDKEPVSKHKIQFSLAWIWRKSGRTERRTCLAFSSSEDFSFQLTTSRTGSHAWLVSNLLKMVATHSYSTHKIGLALQTFNGVPQRRRH